MNIWAVGRNYADHAKELGNAVPATTEDPIIFLKAGTCVVENGTSFSLPTFSDDIHHECEIAFVFNDKLEFSEMTLALDLTARDVQNRLKAAGQPWTLAKSFKSACPLGPLVKAELGKSLSFTFKVNGEIRQSGQTDDMIHSVEKLRKYLIERFPVVTGDIVLTGTPKGVGLIKRGDKLEAELHGFVRASWTVTNT